MTFPWWLSLDLSKVWLISSTLLLYRTTSFFTKLWIVYVILRKWYFQNDGVLHVEYILLELLGKFIHFLRTIIEQIKIVIFKSGITEVNEFQYQKINYKTHKKMAEIRHSIIQNDQSIWNKNTEKGSTSKPEQLEDLEGKIKYFSEFIFNFKTFINNSR